jgi:hypothetical protein
MLLFKKKFLEAIRGGEKTQTIRLWVRPRMAGGQRSYIPGIGYIRIKSVEQVDLHDLTDDDARPDGFPTADALRAEIQAIYSQYPDRGQKAYRIKFVLAPDETKQVRPKGLRPLNPEPLPSQAIPSTTAARPSRVPLPPDGFPLPHRRSN